MRADRINIPGIATMLLVAAAWEASVRTGARDFRIFAGAVSDREAFVGIVRSGELLTNTVHTLRSVLIGWVLAGLIGGALGLIFGLSRFARRWFLASLEVLRPLPAIAFLPVALLLFSFSLTTELVVMVYASIWPMFINTMGGISNVASRLHDVSLTLKLTRAQTLWKVLLPAAAPAIVVGARLCLGTTLVHGDHRRDDRQSARPRLCGGERADVDPTGTDVRLCVVHRRAGDRAQLLPDRCSAPPASGLRTRGGNIMFRARGIRSAAVARPVAASLCCSCSGRRSIR